MEAFETESARPVRRLTPRSRAYARSLADWVAGNHEWHATNTDRYSLPNYW